jgi:hypothetical protein
MTLRRAPLTAALLVLAATLATAPAAPATGPAAPEGSVGHADPWLDPNYRPTPGDWQDYVLAPAGRTVRPTALLAADPRGGSITGTPTAAVRGHGTVRLTAPGDRGTSPLLMLDFGQDVGGTVQITVTGASNPRPDLRVCFSESRMYQALTPAQNGGEAAYAPGCDTANFPNGYPGSPYTWDSDSHALPLAGATLPATLTDPQPRGGFRYATIFLGGPGWVDIGSVDVRFTAAPDQSNLRGYAGHFLSSDNELNKIWYAGAYTVQLDTAAPNTLKSNISPTPGNQCWPYHPGEADHADNTMPYANPNQEVILDGGKRDRDAFTGDLSVEDPTTYLSTDDVPATENTLRALAHQQLPDGFVPGNGRVCPDGSTYFSGSYDLQFVHDVYQTYLYTGDSAFLTELYPTLVGAMTWVRPQVDSTGLLSFAGYGAQGACGTYAYNSCDHLTYVNALYVLTLREMATLAHARQDPRAATGYTTLADQLSAAVNDRLWDATAGAYRMSPENPGVYPQDGNAMAVLAGIADPARTARAMAYLKTHTWSTYGSLTAPAGTPLPSQYEPLPTGDELAARLTGSDPAATADAETLLRTFWGYQLDQDPGSTFWEKISTSGTPGIGSFTSLAHGWATEPTVALSTSVLGVAPLSAGFADYAFAPHPGDLSWAEGTVPGPRGGIDASWRVAGGGLVATVRAPRGETGEYVLPTGSRPVRVTVDGQLVWDAGRSLADRARSVAGTVVLDGISGGPAHHVVITPAN